MKKLLILVLLLAACGSETNESNNGTTVVGNNGSTGTGNNGTATSNNGTVGENNGTTSKNGTTTQDETTGTTGTNNQTTNNNVEDTDLTEIFQAAFGDTGCVAGYCHGGSVDGLVISDPEVALQAMVNVDSIRPSCNLTKLVVPGKPEESLLWMRVRPAALETGEPCVPKMPKGSDGLSEEKAKLIYNWIASGAKL